MEYGEGRIEEICDNMNNLKGVEGSQSKFEIWTDHKNLEYFMKVQKLNRRQACWALYLSRFDFTLKHVPGTKMGKADGLSRRSD